MPTIPDFPTELLDQHHAWHSPGAHGSTSGGRVNPEGTPGAGREFLVFHRNYMAQFRAWYDTHPFSSPPFSDPVQRAALVAPWTEVPSELKQPQYGWNTAWSSSEQRLNDGFPDFPTDDQLGTFIETGIHNNFLHGAAAEHFNEPLLGGFHSPQSTYFYAIHGLVDRWWSAWQRRNKIRVAEIDWDVRRPLRLDRKVIVDITKRFGDVKLTGREGPDIRRPQFDPLELARLQERLGHLERQVQVQARTLIRAQERPPVGDEVTHGGIPRHRESGEVPVNK